MKPDSWHLAPKEGSTEHYNMLDIDWNRTEKSPKDIIDDPAFPEFDFQAYNLDIDGLDGYTTGNDLENDKAGRQKTVVYMAPEDSLDKLADFEGEEYYFKSGAEAVITRY